MELLVILGVFLLSYTLIQATSLVFGVLGKSKNLPPGPKPLPIIGNLLLLGDLPHQSLSKLSDVHGPIMSLKLGQITTLVISSASAAKQVLQKQDLAFANRHIPDALRAHNYSDHSVTFIPTGTQWRALRKILNTNVFSTKSLDANQQLRAHKIEQLVAYCQKASMANDEVDIGGAAFRTSLNLVSNMVCSKDLADPYEDSCKEFKELVGNITMDAGKPNVVDFFPVLRKMDPQGKRRIMTRNFGRLLDIFEDLIEERLGAAGRILGQYDVLDVCLKINQANPGELSRTYIKILLVDMFVAGTDTTSNTLEWAMTEVLHNPHTMIRAKQELEDVIGRGKIVNEDDVLRLPYLSCIVKETLRLHPAIPFLIPRKVENEVELHGYTIPKGTQVLVNAYAIGRDSTIWEDSEEFKPERFLTSHRDVRGQDFELIPFGAGRRMCPGLPLAIRVIPMMLGSLLNNFDWNIDTRIRSKEFDMAERFGLSIRKANPLCLVPIPLN